MVLYDWNEKMCRDYAEALRPMVRFDHGPWAKRIASRLADLPAHATILEIAAGPGFLLAETGKRVPACDLVAQDLAEPMLVIARAELERAGLSARTVCCPAERLAIADQSVDVVLCKQLIHEARDVDQTLAEMLRVLKPGGRAFVIDFDADGSRLAARLVRMLIGITGGRDMAKNFWRSFTAGLRGADVRTRMLQARFADVQYVRTGFDYLLVGTKAS